jgi:hypothetical protein
VVDRIGTGVVDERDGLWYAHVRVRRVDQSDITEIRTWGAHERINVKRASAGEGKG